MFWNVLVFVKRQENYLKKFWSILLIDILFLYMCLQAKNCLLCLQWSNLIFKIFYAVCSDCQEAVEEDLDALYRGLASTLGEKEDHIMVEDLAGQELQRK